MSLWIEVEKDLGSFKIDVAMNVEEGVTGILGYSGAGKSMLLKMIAGVVTPDKGRIVLGDRVLFDSEKGIDVKTRERRVGLLFQSYALFNHMTVYENIQIGMTEDRCQQRERIEELLRLLGIEELVDRKPKQLSGGQKQRVALARMLASSPAVLLLDEPFSALDTHLKYTLEEPFKKALESFQGSVLYVSHNREEVYKYCEQVAIMESGHVVERGDVQTVFEHCQRVATARLVGHRNITPFERLSEAVGYAEKWGIQLDVKDIPKDLCYVGIKEVDIVIGCGKEAGKEYITAEVGMCMKMPDQVEISLARGKERLVYSCSPNEYEKIAPLLAGKQVTVYLPKEKLFFLKE